MLVDIPMHNIMCPYNDIVIHCVVLDFHFQAFTIQFVSVGLKWVKKAITSASTYLIKFFEVYEDKCMP